jgi:nitric oxide reductase NorD protein
MDSIIQDFGEIPEDYLEPAGDGGYNNEENVDQTSNEYENYDYEFLYNEWDHARQQYKKDWCKLNEVPIEGISTNFIADTLNKYRGLLRNINRTFEALRQDEKRLKRQNYGDEIDIDAFIDAYIDLKQGKEIDEKLFIKLNKVERNVAVMFMIDMSGSTSGWINKMEKESLVLLCESLEILGDTYGIYGFSGKTRNRCEVYKIKNFDEKYDNDVKDRISNIQAMDYTRMGASIRHLTMLLNKVEAKTKLLITLSDGKPDDVDGYRGTYGIEDTKKALIEARFQGIHTYCITIDEEAMDYLPYMYGKSNFAVINQIDKLPTKVSDIYRKITA